jgi:hypothetical protein
VECIFCRQLKNQEEFSDEHIIPEAIGGMLTIKSVCKECNGYLGRSIDVHLTDHFLVKARRFELGLAGKSGKIPNPIEHGESVDLPKSKMTYEFDKQGMPKSLHIERKVEKEQLEDGGQRVSISIDTKDKDELPGIVNKILVRSGYHPMFKDEIEKCYKTVKIEHPGMIVSAKIDLLNFKRAFLKMAYELAWLWLGPAYLEDPVGSVIRGCIMDKSRNGEWEDKYEINGSVNITDHMLNLPMWKSETNSHIAFMSRDGNCISCYIRVFQVMDGVLKVTMDSSRYPGFEDRFYSVDPVTKEIRNSTFIDEIARIAK